MEIITGKLNLEDTLSGLEKFLLTKGIVDETGIIVFPENFGWKKRKDKVFHFNDEEIKRALRFLRLNIKYERDNLPEDNYFILPRNLRGWQVTICHEGDTWLETRKGIYKEAFRKAYGLKTKCAPRRHMSPDYTGLKT